MSLLLTGVGISKGVVIGKAYVMTQGQPEVPEYEVPDYLIDDEVARFNEAVAQVREYLYEIKEKISGQTTLDVTEFIEPHILTLNENIIQREPRAIIRKYKINAEWALKRQRDRLIEIMEDTDEPFLTTRRDDLEYIIDRILLVLKQQEIGPLDEADDNSPAARKKVIVVNRLAVSELAALYSGEGLAGFISIHDAPNSHTAIMARSLRIPAVTGVNNANRLIKDGEAVIIDGKYGMAVIEPGDAGINHYEELGAEILAYKKNLNRLRSRPAITKDQRKITLGANIELSSDLAEIDNTGAEEVGLYRTEYLFMNRDEPPGEDEQFEHYRAVAAKLDGIEINIRTLDIGADKSIPGIEGDKSYSNPMLGLRAIRLSLKTPKLFTPQIRAILRAAAYGGINIILPLVTSYQEIIKARAIIQRHREDLLHNGVKTGPVKVGIMIETPAAAVMADFFTSLADFVAVGTNDLTQYTLAIDRSDERVSYLYNNSHPAVIRMVYGIIKAGAGLNKEVLVCGEMAGNPKYTRLLIGMGLKNFSVAPSRLLDIKKHIRAASFTDAKMFADEIINASDPGRIDTLIARLNQ